MGSGRPCSSTANSTAEHWAPTRYEEELLEEEASAEARAAGEATTSQFGAPPRVVKLGEWLYSAGLRKQIVAQEESDIHVMAS